MKKSSLLFTTLLLLILFSSCTRIYTTGASNMPISTLPVNTKEKGDMNVSAAYANYDVANSTKNNSYYRFLSISAFKFNAHYALTDNSTIGLGYSYNIRKPYTGNTFNASYNYGQQFETEHRKRDSQYGFDLLAGFQFQHSNNFMEVSEYLYDFYGTSDSSGTTIFYYDYDIYPLGYFKLNQNDMRLYFQPSFSFENKYFEFFLGTSIGYQHSFKYDAQLTELYQPYLEDPTEDNPLVYYTNNTDFLFGETFLGFGLGPDFCGLFYNTGIGYSTDQFQHVYGFSNIGIRSNFSALKKKSE